MFDRYLKSLILDRSLRKLNFTRGSFSDPLRYEKKSHKTSHFCHNISVKSDHGPKPNDSTGRSLATSNEPYQAGRRPSPEDAGESMGIFT